MLWLFLFCNFALCCVEFEFCLLLYFFLYCFWVQPWLLFLACWLWIGLLFFVWYLTEFLDCYYLFSVFPFLVRFAVGLFVVFTLLIFFWILQVCINFCICVVVWHVVIVVVRVFWLASMNTFDSAAKERAITRNVVYNIWNFVDCCTSLVFCFAVFLLRIVGRSFYISIFVDEICK